jgi:hypothetical protein
MRRSAALAHRRELLATTAALQRLRLRVGLHALDSRCSALDGAARRGLGLGALLLPLALAFGAVRRRGAVGAVLCFAAARRLLRGLRRGSATAPPRR